MVPSFLFLEICSQFFSSVKYLKVCANFYTVNIIVLFNVLGSKHVKENMIKIKTYSRGHKELKC